MRLQIFVSQHCSTCGRSLALGAALAAHYPDMAVEVVDLDEPSVEGPEQVFAVPTFLLDGELLCLGNRDEGWLRQRIEAIRKSKVA